MIDNHIFILDKFNKFSIRALLVAFEKWFPEINYKVLKVEEIDSNPLPGFYYFSFNSINAKFYIELAQKLKQKKNIKIACGGPHPSARSEEMTKYFDKVCNGEGEIVLKEIVEDFESGIDGKKIYKGTKKVDLNHFDAYPKKKNLFGAIEIMRGCTFSCKYCQTPQLYKGKLRYKSIDRILDDVSFGISHNKTDLRFIAPDSASYFYDNGINILMIEKLLDKLHNLLYNKGRIFYGSFPSEINPYFVNEEFVKLIKHYCHNRRVVIGLQSASRKLLKKMNRPENIEKVEEAINLFLKYKFTVDVDFIFGLPFETSETLKETIEWIEKWHNKVRIHSHYFMPLPGSKWEDLTPTEMPEYFERFVKSLEGKSRLFGQWNTQQNIAYCLKD
ncbi:TIGR04013 family B12-binding domain/radical SAM domain-containing protein [Calditerrivibrio nitroreducens]|uniref:Radical SAM domain protein n=1 Tax=Calditerrivibrio nitroreducens (strain DSM 19672 / NBRC 101217 / Yu37-1) TaxID=768670 RepID=E4TFN9_CALNY|nr:TIGR04013 family B12-binding domain/radical SAM domain-containing protein [Calditerrivibrio nitroreducens]ADR18507.1 Radical SAM domain protein [Calditerrivibrio nitroreducens DSM 19672]